MRRGRMRCNGCPASPDILILTNAATLRESAYCNKKAGENRLLPVQYQTPYSVISQITTPSPPKNTKAIRSAAPRAAPI